MKSIQILHTIAGIIPFAWLLLFLAILGIGTVHLGYIPQYGNHIDPDSLNIHFLGFLHMIFGLLGTASTCVWVTLAAIMISSTPKIALRKIPTILFFIGVGGFFLFKYAFTEQFLWVFD
jgi:hypothetical protein